MSSMEFKTTDASDVVVEAVRGVRNCKKTEGFSFLFMLMMA